MYVIYMYIYVHESRPVRVRSALINPRITLELRKKHEFELVEPPEVKPSEVQNLSTRMLVKS